MKKNTTGFTLVEMSVVLVIIGLLIGGTLAGRSLLRQSQLASVVRDEQTYVQAAQQFKEKYNYLPGDFPNATNYWGAAGGNSTDNWTATCYGSGSTSGPATCNGDGNGQLAPDTTTWDEALRFWQHLANAGLIQGQYTGVIGSGGSIDHVVGINCPASRMEGGGFGISYNGIFSGDSVWFDGIYRHTLFFGTYQAGNVPINPIFTASEAQSLDSKYDDGIPSSGSIRSLKNGSQANCATSSAPYAYRVSTTGPACGLIFITGF